MMICTAAVLKHEIKILEYLYLNLEFSSRSFFRTVFFILILILEHLDNL